MIIDRHYHFRRTDGDDGSASEANGTISDVTAYNIKWFYQVDTQVDSCHKF